MAKLTELGKTDNKVVGTKQTIHVIKTSSAKIVFLACDVDQKIKKQIINLCKEKNISIKMVDSKLELGRACGIDVSAACAALLN